MRGRKTKLNDELTQRICKLLQMGCDQKTAASICEISEKTFHNWKERGQKGETPYVTFFDTASRARNMYKARLLKIIMEAAEGIAPRHGDWKAAAWALERAFPKEYAPVYREQVQESQQPKQQSIGIGLVLQFPDGSRQGINIDECQRLFADFPVIENQPAPGLPQSDDGDDEFGFGQLGDDGNGSEPRFSPP